MGYFWIHNDEQLICLVEGYLTNARFKTNFDKTHSDLAAFIGEAIRIYVNQSAQVNKGASVQGAKTPT
jgi:hypothetical protein